MPHATRPDVVAYLFCMPGNPFKNPTFQQATGLYHAPLGPHSSYANPILGAKGPKEVTMLREYLVSFNNALLLHNFNLNKACADVADATGAALWKRIGRRYWKQFQLDDKFREAAREEGHTPFTLAARYGCTDRLKGYSAVNLGNTVTRLALILGGPDPKNPALPRSDFEVFSTLLAKCEYQSWQTAYANKRKKIPVLIQTQKDALQDAIDCAGSLTTPQVIRLLDSLDNTQAMLQVFHDDESKKTLEEGKELLLNLRGAIDEDFKLPEGCDQKKLVPALRKAVSMLARQSDAARITLLTHEAILRAGGDNDDDYAEIPRLSDLSPNDISDWQSGTEAYDPLSTEQVKVWLGIDGKSLIDHKGVLPFMNPRYDDSDTRRNPADHVEWFKDEKNGAPLTPRWHQLIAMLAMIHMAFDGKPVAVLDEVGIGKTIQTIGVIMLLTWYREFYTKKGHFPGSFKDKKWPKSADGNIPDAPHLIVVPPSLVLQWTQEFKKFAVRGTFDLLKYEGTRRSHDDIIKGFMTVAHNPLSRRVIIASHSAVVDDMNKEVVLNRPNPHSFVESWEKEDRKKWVGVFGLRWMTLAVDEAHMVRILGKKWLIVRALRNLSEFVVALTATPIMNTPADLWNLARAIVVEGFDTEHDNTAFADMVTRIARGKKMDLQTRAVTFESTLAPKDGETPLPSNTYKIALSHLLDLRKRLAGNVIRRTLFSKDHEGRLLSGMDIYLEIPLKTRPYPHEAVILENTARELSGAEKGSRAWALKSFHNAYRQAIPHPCFNPVIKWGSTYRDTGRWHNLEEYEVDRSVKCDMVVELLKHHLATDNALPMTVNDAEITWPDPIPRTTSEEAEDDDAPAQPLEMPALSKDYRIANALVVNPAFGPFPRPDALGPDKVIIYLGWPSLYTTWAALLTVHGIPHLALNGTMSAKKKDQVLQQFIGSERDGPRVLLMSKVGLFGHNISCASIIIIVDNLWSRSEDQQLIGRAWRFPQQKKVLVYRPIYKGTTDEYLNTIAADKGTMYDAFLTTTSALKALHRKMIGAEQSDEEAPPQGQDDDSGDDSPPAKKPSKPKAARKPKDPKGKGKAKVIKSKPEVESEDDATTTKAPPKPRPRPKKDQQTPPVAGPSSSVAVPPLPTPGPSEPATVAITNPEVAALSAQIAIMQAAMAGLMERMGGGLTSTPPQGGIPGTAPVQAMPAAPVQATPVAPLQPTPREPEQAAAPGTALTLEISPASQTDAPPPTVPSPSFAPDPDRPAMDQHGNLMSADKIDFSEPVTPTVPTTPLPADSPTAPVLPPTQSAAPVPADATDNSRPPVLDEDRDAEGETDIEMMDGTAPQEQENHEQPTQGSKKDSDLLPEAPAGQTEIEGTFELRSISGKRGRSESSELSPPPESIPPVKKGKPLDSASHSPRSASREPTAPPVATRPSSEARLTPAAPRALSESNENALTSDLDFQYHDANDYAPGMDEDDFATGFGEGSQTGGASQPVAGPSRRGPSYGASADPLGDYTQAPPRPRTPPANTPPLARAASSLPSRDTTKSKRGSMRGRSKSRK